MIFPGLAGGEMKSIGGQSVAVFRNPTPDFFGMVDQALRPQNSMKACISVRKAV